MNTNEIIDSLKNEAAKNACFNAVAHVFALRKRARYQVTVGALAQKMKMEGFNYDNNELGEVLTFLASLGFGHVEKDRNGRPRALKGVKVTLQSIGAIALRQEGALKSYRQRNRFKPLTSEQAPVIKRAQPVEDTGKAFAVGLVVLVNGKSVTMQLPKGFSADDINALVSKFGVKQDRKEDIA